MDSETKMTLLFAEKNPLALKRYLLKRYSNEIDKIKNRLTEYFKEEVDVYFTFESMKNVWAFDLDFYLVNNKAKYPISDAGSRKLPVCFVIVPPGYKKSGSDERLFDAEYIYKVIPKKGISVLYKKKVKNISWGRLFNEALKVNLSKSTIYTKSF